MDAQVRGMSFGTALRRLLPYLRPERVPLIGAAVMALAGMLCGLVIPVVIQRLLDGPVAGHDPGALPWLIGLLLVLGIGEAGLFYLRRRLTARPTALIEARMRGDLYRHLQQLPVEFHDRWPSGQLLTRATSDVGRVRRYLSFPGIFLLVNVATLLTGLVVLTLMSPVLGLITTVCTAPLVVISTVYERQYKKVARLAQDQEGELATQVEESVLGIRVLKAFGRGGHMAHRFRAGAERLRGTQLRKARILATLWTGIILLPELGLAAQLVVGAIGMVHGTITAGTLVAAIAIAGYLRWPTDSMGWLLSQASEFAAACERYWQLRDIPLTVADPERPRPLPATSHGRLRFENVRFRYPGAEHEVLRGVDLAIAPGETMALVGPTGSGKTTLATLVGRLADVTAGRITVDGTDIRHLRLTDLRTVVATAFEDPVLFSASVRENVALGSPDATDDQVWQALRVAQAAEFVQELPWGLDTRVGEEGLTLSGGQRQRIALARAVVGRPAVLVLDDPLSALDVHTEAEVERALRHVLREVTALVVAHRPSTVQLADRVAVLTDGRITTVGRHHDLLATDPAYRALLATETAADETEVVA